MVEDKKTKNTNYIMLSAEAYKSQILMNVIMGTSKSRVLVLTNQNRATDTSVGGTEALFP